MRRRWRSRGLRARLTLIASLALAVGLALGSILLVRSFAHSRLSALDRASGTVADNLTRLDAAGALPSVLPVQAGQSAQVVDTSGAVKAVSPGTLRTLPLVPVEDLRAHAGHAPYEVTVDALDGEGLSRVRVVASHSGWVVIAVSLRDERDTLRGLTRGVLVVVPVLILLVALTIWLLLGRALGAVSDLQRTAAAITDPGAGIRLPVPGGHDEIRGLTETLNGMLDRLAAASERERSFLADAAHELRSPLASMRAQLEVARSHPGTTTVGEVAEGSLADVDRLTELVEGLLTLARLDAGPQPGPAEVDLAALAGVPEQGPVPVVGDGPSLARAVDNLTSNARRHARGTVRVTVAVAGPWAEVRVDDDGPGIPAADRERVFDRFVRLDDARSRDLGGSGLGLAIVRTTARAHGGDVEVADSDLGGARFVLRVPTLLTR